MNYVEKLVDTQDAVDTSAAPASTGDAAAKSRKQPGEVLMAGTSGGLTFLEEEFRDTLNDICQFHAGAKHSIRDCEELKRALGVPQEPKQPRRNSGDDRHYNRRYDNNPRYKDYYL